MGRAKKEKLETSTDASLQILTANATEESIVTAADVEERKKDANKPLYLKRI